MNPKKAKQILTDAKLTGFSKDSLYINYNSVWYLCVAEGDKDATLDGQFTADELEAIAAWMRDPGGVVDA